MRGNKKGRQTVEAEEEALLEALLRTARNIIVPNHCNNQLVVGGI